MYVWNRQKTPEGSGKVYFRLPYFSDHRRRVMGIERTAAGLRDAPAFALLPLSGLDHRQNGPTDRLWQRRPDGDDAGEVGAFFANCTGFCTGEK